MNVEEKFKEQEIVPDIIDSAPKALLDIKYTNDLKVTLGNELTPSQVKETPTVRWNSESDTYYTLAFIDPDAPSRANPIRREFNHWLVVNIPNNDVSKGDILVDYFGSGPFQDTGLHRYTFLVYKQHGKVRFEESHVTVENKEGRRHFSIKKFAEKYGFGKPVAGNFFVAQWEK